MIKADVALDGVAVVVRGHFNAAIFSPLWLLQQELIGARDFTTASIDVITSDFASFSTGWLNCQVASDALQANVMDPADFERARDVVVGILNALPHTPVGALGINRHLHFAPRDTEQYHAIGDQLVPKAFWEDLVSLPVTRDVVVWGQRPDKFGGRVQIRVEPSLRFPGHVYVSHNDHFSLEVVEEHPKTRQQAWAQAQEAKPIEPSASNIPVVTEILLNNWESSIERSNAAVNAIARIG
ncbi:hypothetical protein AU197_14450 [Mycobacterium sp. IS-1590]|uniref:hypothetical protein n=1 Tax=Mycobacterium sp. IS-1590 TaxID=1772286 RepID=UPI00074A1528|nr:hypothetical protein [Mycobacterium sp. IS-1590]KUI42311.1 hypothetical protein AU197_14450 [Mycobacterium sp. IS-1590]